jgi:pyruvate dehydrogenase E1 component alpha subunit
MHLFDLEAGFLGAVPIVGSTIPMAVGAAWAARLRGDDRILVTFFGEGATEEGVFYEAINFAAVKKLPILFVCENNWYSVYSPLSVRQPSGVEVMAKATAHGVPARQGDGNDLLQVYRIAEEAIASVRRGEGPMFLEFETYRWREHCGPNFDNTLGYRTEAEYEQWRRRCPVDRFESYLTTVGVITSDESGKMRSEIDAEIAEAVAFAKSSPFPDPREASRFTYAE